MKKHHIFLFPNDHFLDIRPYQYGWKACEPLHSFVPFVRKGELDKIPLPFSFVIQRS